MTAIEYSPAKLRELVMYVAEKSQGDRYFGKTKLNKILFFSDFTAYLRTGQPITGAKYQHLDQGPCPQQLLPVLKALRGDLQVVQEATYVGVRQRLVPLRKADPSLFTGSELAVVDEILDILRPLNNKDASDLSHHTVAYRLTSDRQEIPYGTAVLSHEGPSEDDLRWLRKESREKVGGAAR